MNILALNNTKSSSTFETRKNVINAILNLHWSYNKACVYYHASRISIYRFVKKIKIIHVMKASHYFLISQKVHILMHIMMN